MIHLMDLVAGSKDICKNCGEEIEWVPTPIDDFWSHVGGVMRCDGGAVGGVDHNSDYAEATGEYDNTRKPVPEGLVKPNPLRTPAHENKINYNEIPFINETRWCPTCQEYVTLDPMDKPLNTCSECGHENL
jgi:hypothetical protein